MDQQKSSSNTTVRAKRRPALQLRAQPEQYRLGHYHKVDLAHAARLFSPIGLPLAWRAQEAKRLLVSFCTWLDAQLSKPIRVRNRAGVRRIQLLGAIRYIVDEKNKCIYLNELREGVFEETNYILEIGKPLITSYWLNPVLERAGVLPRDQGDLFFEEDFFRVKDWIVTATFRILKSNRRFHELRNKLLPRAFGLPGDIYRLALASRTKTIGPLLDSRTLNVVWKNQGAFRQVAGENPQLLPLLQAYIRSKLSNRLENTCDPIASLKSALKRDGFSEAAWRYVANNGSRIFRVPWSISIDTAPFEAARVYLRMLETAGLPPPPPPLVARTLLHGYNQNALDKVRLRHDFHDKINPHALRMALLESHSRRRDPGLLEFLDSFMGVCWWSENSFPLIDKNQAKSGWPWLVKQWKRSETEHAIEIDSNNQHWKTRLGGFWIGGWLVLPISSTHELKMEAMAMRNCLVDFKDDCASGSVEIYSVRCPITRKRKACIGYHFENNFPVIFDVREFANTPPTREIQHIAEVTLLRLRKGVSEPWKIQPE